MDGPNSAEIAPAAASACGPVAAALAGPTLSAMGRSFLARLQNPGNNTCACLPSCWCKRTKTGHALRWYTPGRWHDLPNPAEFDHFPKS